MTVRLDVNTGRATITIDDPERRNPISTTTMAELLDTTQTALADHQVRLLVYTGAGDQAFSAGGDLSGSFADETVGLHRERGRLADLFRLMQRGGKPTIARVNGHALAGGFGLAVACDITICVDDAKLGVPEIGVGLWPMMISAVLVRAMPPKVVLEMMLTGRLLTPEEAQSLGAVNRVVPRAVLDAAVDEVCDRLMELSSTSLMLGRDSFYSMADSGLDTALDRLQGGLTALTATEDATEGVAAFRKKRSPRWG
ncbi:MAG: enoyl-CoA hydratase-related protein [Actinobacteria bacterium]|nr:enoyl-CoA hydratase-related protein [Actinomycetota bacterium]